MTALQEFAAFIEQIHFDALTEPVVQTAKRCITEALECFFSHGSDFRKDAALRFLASSFQSEGAHLLGSSHLTSAENAAFYFSMALSVNPRLDCHRQSLCHAGSVAIPTAFAVAENMKKGGDALIEGIVAGYEAMIRLCLALSRGDIPPAVRRTALAASFCGAVTAAKIMGLPRSQLAAAASLSLHASFGLNEWAVSGTGEDALQSAWGAKNGIFCASLAAAGMPASMSALEGESGLFAAYHTQDGLTVFKSPCSKGFYILDTEFKPVAACLLLQTPCQLAHALTQEYAIHPADIEHIDIYVAEKVARHVGIQRQRDFASKGQAENSIPFGVSSSVCASDLSHIQWSPPFSPDVLALAQHCRVQIDSQLNDSFPRTFPSHIQICLKNGDVRSGAQNDYTPLSFEESILRSCAACDRSLGRARAEALFKRINTLEKQTDIASIMDLFSSSHPL